MTGDFQGNQSRKAWNRGAARALPRGQARSIKELTMSDIPATDWTPADHANDKPGSEGATARRLSGKVADGVEKVVERLNGGIAAAKTQGASAYGVARRKAQDVAGAVDPMVREKPYAAIGAALGLGVVLGMLISRPRVIYVRPPH